METGKKIVLRKQGLKTLDKATEINAAISDGSAANVSEVDLSHNSIA